MNDQNHTYSYYFPSPHVKSKVPSAARMQIWSTFQQSNQNTQQIDFVDEEKEMKNTQPF